jgi:hypothetical protein
MHFFRGGKPTFLTISLRRYQLNRLKSCSATVRNQFEIHAVLCEGEIVSYEFAKFSYEKFNGSYEMILFSYEMISVSYETMVFSYEKFAVSYEKFVISYEMVIASQSILVSFKTNYLFPL